MCMNHKRVCLDMFHHFHDTVLFHFVDLNITAICFASSQVGCIYFHVGIEKEDWMQQCV